jgi:deoxyribodipyrimidine photo-lyase
MKSRRTLIIPHKRGLLSITTAASSTTTTSQKTRIQKTINPSALPAKIQLRRPVFSSLEPRNEDEDEEKYNIDDTSIRTIEFDSSLAPQPFLEPELVQRIVEGRNRKEKDGDNDNDNKDHENEDKKQGESSLTAQLSTEREVRRRAAQTEYGSMAIRGRSNVRGRGRR